MAMFLIRRRKCYDSAWQDKRTVSIHPNGRAWHEPHRTRNARREGLLGYAHGPDAPIAAANTAYARAQQARTLVFVEGISDQIAVETLARRKGVDLDRLSVVVFPVGGSKSVTRYLREFGPMGEGKTLAGLCDADAAGIFSRALFNTGFTSVRSPDDMAEIGFFICDRYLEDELIRALGPERIVEIIQSQGDIAPLQTLQAQAQWRDRPLAEQIRRFFSSKARRSLRYARLLVEACDSNRIPRPLEAVVERVSETVRL